MNSSVSPHSSNTSLTFIQKNILYIGILLDLTILDIVSKWLIEKNLPQGTSILIIDKLLSLTLSHNDAIAFSLPVPGKLVALFTPFLLGLLIYLVIQSCDISKKITKIALILLIAGTLGNFIDRIWRGYVVDFIDFSFWPSFNFADMYLTVGVLILLFCAAKNKSV